MCFISRPSVIETCWRHYGKSKGDLLLLSGSSPRTGTAFGSFDQWCNTRRKMMRNDSPGFVP